MCDPERFETLRSGLVLPVEVLRLGHRLESSEGFRFKLDGEGGLLVAPFDQLSAEDLAALRRWRWHLTALLSQTSGADDLALPGDPAREERRAS